jgi:hypothetical protein
MMIEHRNPFAEQYKSGVDTQPQIDLRLVSLRQAMFWGQTIPGR